MQVFGSDSKLSHLDQQNEKVWTFKFFKKKYVCLIMTGNESLEKVTPFPWIGHNFKPCHKRNDRSKFLGKQKQTIPIKWDIWWVKTSKTLSQTFSKCDIPFSFLCNYFVKYFTAQIVNYFIIIYIVKTFRTQVCLVDLVLSLSNKIKYCSFLYVTHSLSLDCLICYETIACKTLTMCWDKLSEVIAWLTSKCLWSGRRW